MKREEFLSKASAPAMTLAMAMILALITAFALISLTGGSLTAYADDEAYALTPATGLQTQAEGEETWGGTGTSNLEFTANKTYSERIVVQGNVVVTIQEGVTVMAEKGITVPSDASLTLTGDGKLVTGKLSSNAAWSYYAGIGGCPTDYNTGDITIDGPTVEAYGGDRAAGIGGGYNPSTNKGNVSNGIIEIKSGTVTATGGLSAAGIGGGYLGNGGKILISGGTVTASSKPTTGGTTYSAGIGAGYGNGNFGAISISGGTITATSTDGAAIGAGTSAQQTTGGSVTITGGNVTAHGSIGGASDVDNDHSSAEINLSYTNDTDSIYAESYQCQSRCLSVAAPAVALKVKEDGTFIPQGSGVDPSLINGKTLVKPTITVQYLSHKQDADAEIETVSDSKEYLYGEAAAQPENITNDRAVAFGYWSTNADAVDAEEAGKWDFSNALTNDNIANLKDPLSLYAVWRFDYIVSFKTAEGSGTMDDVRVYKWKDGNETGKPTYELPECGYTPGDSRAFAGWQIGDVDTELKHPGDTIEISEDTTITARWRNVLSLTFYPEKGSGTMDMALVPCGDTYKLPDCTFTAPDEWQEFDQWKIGDTLYNAGDSIKVEDELRIYATWKYSNEATISFDAGEGAGSMEDITWPVGKMYTIPTAKFTAPEYKHFDYWLVDMSENKKNPDDEIQILKDISLTAVWDWNATVNVLKKSNGGSGSMAVESNYPVGPEYTVPECTFEAPEGMVFDCWKLGTGDEDPTYKPGDKISFAAGGNVYLVAQWVTPWVRLQHEIDAAEDGDAIALVRDVVFADQDTADNLGPITVSGKGITIDLNGHSINRNLSSAVSGGNVITVESGAALTICDTSDGEKGAVTGGNNTNSGGGVFVSGAFTLEDASINGNQSGDYGGGVYVGNDATFTLKSGNVSGNTVRSDSTYAYGGGVYVGSGATFAMEDGSITENTASSKASNGGGVCVDGGTFVLRGGSISANQVINGTAGSDYGNGGGVFLASGIFTMSGGSISQNTAAQSKYGGGICVYGGTMNLEGSPVISENTVPGSGGTKSASNLWLKSGKKVNIAGELTADAKVGIRTQNTPAPYTTFTSGLNGNGDASAFTSDMGSTTDPIDVVLNVDGEAVVGHACTIVFAKGEAEGGEITGRMDNLALPQGAAYKLPENTAFKASDSTIMFAGWKIEKTGEVKQPGETIKIDTDVMRGDLERYIDITATWKVHAHEWSDPVYTWADDCSTATASRKCNVCGETETETVPTTSKVTRPVTCTVDGTTDYTAVFENAAFEEKTKTVTVDALGHDWGEPTYVWTDDNSSVTATRICKHDDAHVDKETVQTSSTIVTAATCEAPGENEYKASFKNSAFETQTKKASTPATGHTWGDATYTWADDNSSVTATHTCSVCGKTESDAVATTYEVLEAATCSKAGKGRYTATFENASFAVAAKDVEIPIDPDAHAWGEWEITKEATETENGEEQRTCEHNASHTETRIIPAKNHEHKLTHVDAKAATCTEDGNIEYWVCKEGDNPCGRYFSDAEGTKEIEKEDTVVKATGHTPAEAVKENEVAATCETDGSYDEVVRCKDCGVELSRVTKTIPALGHDWGEPTYAWTDDNGSVTATRTCKHDDNHMQIETAQTTAVQTAPTCEEDGSTTYTASFENAAFEPQEKTVAIPATGHTWSNATYTWADDNSSVTAMHACSVCEKTESETVDATYEVLEAATCAKAGKGRYSATFENEAFAAAAKDVEIPIDPDAHDWGEWVVMKEATETEDGEEVRTCEHDALHTETRVIPAKGKSDSGDDSGSDAQPGSDPNQKGADGTAAGPGASKASAAAAIASMGAAADPAGSVYGKLRLKSTKQAKASITLSWSKVGGAAKYVVYGNKRGAGLRELATVTGASLTVKDVAGAKLKKGTYYKFVVVALDASNSVVSTSKAVHVATKGGKVTNPKKVTAKKGSRSVSKLALKKGKSAKLKASATKASKKLKLKKCRKVSFESSNPAIATVSKSGKVKAKAKGTCYVYAYAQNGAFKKVKVTVK